MKLTLNNVSKNYAGVKAVDGITYSMEKGVYGLLGVNGAGKTTLMRMLCTLMPPTKGKITWNGNDIFSSGAAYRDILGYLPQDFGYYPDLSIHDYMMYIASIKGIRPIPARKKMELLLEQVGLEKYKKRKMKNLSGGMLRRVGIAQAMLNNPQILVLDEPTAGLDPNERIRFRNLISELAEERLVLLSTHIVSDIAYIAKEIMLMKEGRLIYTGTSETLITSMEGIVWHCRVPRQKVDAYCKQYQVGNIRAGSGDAELRILSKIPPAENAIPAEATLEDAFLLYFGEKAGDENDVVM